MEPYSLDPDSVATLSYRINEQERTTTRLGGDVDRLDRQSAVHDEQINGSGGLVKAMDRLGEKVEGLHKALYAFAGSFIAAAIGIALAVSQIH